MDQLMQARAEIDRIDAELARLFEARMQAVEGVIAYKQATGMPVLDAGREEQVIEKNTARIERAELRDYYAQWQKDLMALSRQYQSRVLGRDRVAYQGVEGAFSHIALTRLFPRARAIKCPTWAEVFRQVEEGAAAFGVLPFENSTTGDVGEVLDLCFSHNCYVTQVYDLPVVQNLLGLPGAKLSDIRLVYSHPQGLRQCAPLLRQLGLQTIESPNTAMAAQHVAETGDKTIGAIASAETAQLYGLEVLAAGANSAEGNTTRFIVISRQPAEKGNRFSLLFTVDHKAGQLARVIQIIGREGFNMESIKSRPLPHTPWEYYFYVELVGDASQQNARGLLEQLNGVCRSVKLLGVFSKEEQQ